jgi:hypothetical protein
MMRSFFPLELLFGVDALRTSARADGFRSRFGELERRRGDRRREEGFCGVGVIIL